MSPTCVNGEPRCQFLSFVESVQPRCIVQEVEDWLWGLVLKECPGRDMGLSMQGRTSLAILDGANLRDHSRCLLRKDHLFIVCSSSSTYHPFQDPCAHDLDIYFGTIVTIHPELFTN